MNSPKFSVITPSRGDRPNALAQAIDSVQQAAEQAGLLPDDVEMYVGFDGVKGERVRNHPFVRYVDFPYEGNFGNGIRNALLHACHGERVVFVDDDNMLLPAAFTIYQEYPDSEMVIARIDVSSAFDIAYLPQEETDRELVRLSNIDPLCLCLSRDLVVNRCDGWKVYTGYDSDFKNILAWYRRAHNVAITTNMVGVYDAGRGMDDKGLNSRQQLLETHQA